MLEPQLLRLKHAAQHAGSSGASWTSYLLASHEALSKLVGRGSFVEELQSSQCYEIARASLFASWSKGSKQASPAAHGTADQQQTFLDRSEAYQ